MLYGSAVSTKPSKEQTHHGAGGPPHGLKFSAEVAAVHRTYILMNYDCYSNNIITMTMMIIMNNYYDFSLVSFFRGPRAHDLK